MEMQSDEKPLVKDWTVMFLFASDNELSPLTISQLKAIKDAYSHPQVNVLVLFDPSAPGVATKLLHVNGNGDGHTTSAGRENSSVEGDAVRAEDIDEERGPASAKMKEALKDSDSVPATEALDNFIGYCRENHPAKNYVLFLVGHGLVVGNDSFLPDQHPVSSIKLCDLGRILRGFSNKQNGTLQLLALHSCAMSAVEVAYELRGAARYMLGSEGVTYIGSYPYRDLLRKLFDTMNDSAKLAKSGNPAAADSEEEQVESLVEKLYLDALRNTKDFIMMGYSLDLALCSLASERYVPLTDTIKELVFQLKKAVNTDHGRELILLAHWEAQSYWDENYTDLYDFCLCLKRKCDSLADTLSQGAKLSKEVEELSTKVHGGAELCSESKEPDSMRNRAKELLERSKLLHTLADLLRLAAGLREMVEMLKGLSDACEAVQWQLSPKAPNRRNAIILRADNFGTKYPYSHGLSIYFPWSRPLDSEPPPPLTPIVPGVKPREPKTTDDNVPISRALTNYESYAFSQPDLFGDDSWLSFLELYFEKTQRKPRREEEGSDLGMGDDSPEVTQRRQALSHEFHGGGGALAKEIGSYSKEIGSYGDCSCPSIKNYPTEILTTVVSTTEDGKKEKKINVREFSCTMPVLNGTK
jgi:hypothetical protein